MKEGGLMMENKCVLGACKLAAFLYSLCTNILAPLLVSISREFGIGLQKSGGMFLAFFAGNVAACIVSGRLVGRFGKVRIFYSSLICMTVLCGMIGAPRRSGSFAPRCSCWICDPDHAGDCSFHTG